MGDDDIDEYDDSSSEYEDDLSFSDLHSKSAQRILCTFSLLLFSLYLYYFQMQTLLRQLYFLILPTSLCTICIREYPISVVNYLSMILCDEVVYEERSTGRSSEISFDIKREMSERSVMSTQTAEIEIESVAYTEDISHYGEELEFHFPNEYMLTLDELVRSRPSVLQARRVSLGDDRNRHVLEDGIRLVETTSGKYLCVNFNTHDVYLNQSFVKETCTFYIVRTSIEFEALGVAIVHPDTKLLHYLGQNFKRNLIVSSKHLHTREEFHLIQHPESSLSFALKLHAARFGKGLWIAPEVKGSALGLSKRSSDAVYFTFERMDGSPAKQNAQRKTIRPKMTSSKETLVLPWITAEHPSFLQAPLGDFQKIHTADLVISAEEFYETVVDDESVQQLHNDLEPSAWSTHPYIHGPVQRHQFSIPGIGEVDEYHHFEFNTDRTELQFQTKIYSQQVPHGTCFSIETVYNVVDQSGQCGSHSHLEVQCAVHFNTSTEFESQIIKEAHIGARRSVLNMLDYLVQKQNSLNSIGSELIQRTASSLVMTHLMDSIPFHSQGHATPPSTLPITVAPHTI